MGRRPQAPARLGELHRPVEAVVVGEGEGLVAQLARPQHQLLDVRGAVEEGEVGVAVEFGVGRFMLVVLTGPSRQSRGHGTP